MVVKEIVDGIKHKADEKGLALTLEGRGFPPYHQRKFDLFPAHNHQFDRKLGKIHARGQGDSFH